MDKYRLSERDICTKFIAPAILQAGWLQEQFHEEVSFTDGRVMVRGKLAARIRNPEAPINLNDLLRQRTVEGERLPQSLLAQAFG